MNKIFFLLATLFYLPLAGEVEGSFLFAQRQTTSSSFLLPSQKGNTAVSFQPDGQLSQYITPAKPVKWGMDTAWDWDINVVRGTNTIGVDILKDGIGRCSFQTTDTVDASGNLSDAQKTALQSRLDHIALSGTKNINLNSDQDSYCGNADYVALFKNNPQRWYKLIKATVKYCRQKGFNVVSISPFNEPDYAGWQQGSQASFKEVARLITEDPDLAGIEISAGNTLNCDNALSWYNAVKPYVKKGNTHQLAGTMANYNAFWEAVAKDGNTGVADELHNTMEAFIAIHHGANEGIWWGWEGICRGQFCEASAYGKEIGYGENSDNWTGAAVYKWDRPTSDGAAEERINAFVGASERQAKPSTFDIISTDRPVYYNGYGPVYSYPQYVPADANGTYQSDNQKNAECSVGIQYGEDAPLDYPCSGNFVIMNLSCHYCLAYTTTSTTLSLQNYYKKPNTKQYWTVDTVQCTIGGDFGYSTLRAPGSSDGKFVTTSEEWSLASGKGLNYTVNWANSGRNLYLFEYAGGNSWYIRNRYTGLYLQPKEGKTTIGTAIVMEPFTGSTIQKWRFIPVPSDLSKMTKMELEAPAKPEGLTATTQPGAVRLSWTAGTDADLSGYNIFRTAVGNQDTALGSTDGAAWDMIGRVITGNTFLDNDVAQGRTYLYKIKAVDGNRNQSVSSDSITVKASDAHALVAHYAFDSNATDTTANMLDAALSGTVAYKKASGKAMQGTAALYFDGSTTCGVLPAALGAMSEMTISMWVYNSNSTTKWTRFFDFGNDTDHYFFFTPNCDGSKSRLVLKNGGDEQILTASKVGFGWHYIAAILAKDSVTLYIDDKAVTSTAITIRPSDFMPKRNYIGCSQFTADPLFKGNMDDLRIYNYALSAKEVAAIKAGSELPTGDANKDGMVTVADANLTINYSLGNTTDKETIDTYNADMDLDGNITKADAELIVNKYLK